MANRSLLMKHAISVLTSATTNGALNYALRVNRISLDDLVSLSKDQAMELPWVGPKVWNEARHLAHVYNF